MANRFFKGTREHVTLPLKAECLSPSGAKHEVNFKGKYKVLNTVEQKEMREALESKAISPEEGIRRVLVGWEDVQDSNNQPIEYDEEAREEALLIPYYLEALGEGALLIIYGKKTMEAVRAKNSSKPARGG